MNTKKRRTSMATFVRCTELRELAGMSIDTLVAKVDGRPAKSSVQRLEDQRAIRTSNAFKVANTINSELVKAGHDAIDVKKEVKRI